MGEDYLAEKYLTPAQVVGHIKNGSMLGVATGTPGTFEIDVELGRPPKESTHDFEARGPIRVVGGVVCIRDIYDLMEWNPTCPQDQEVPCKDGIYEVSLRSDFPRSGVLGDEQSIRIYLDPAQVMPEYISDEIPRLY